MHTHTHTHTYTHTHTQTQICLSKKKLAWWTFVQSACQLHSLKPCDIHSKSVHSCCVSIQGLHPSKDPVFAVFEGESFRETLLTASAIIKWDGVAFGAFPGCVTRCFTLVSRFLPPRPSKVTIYATRCRRFLFFFLLFLGARRILGYVRPQRIVVVHPPKRGKEGRICGLHLEEPSNWDSLRVASWRNWTSNASSEGCRPWNETQH